MSKIWWTKERVRSGLARFVRDYFAGNERNLPWNWHSYRIAVPEKDRREATRLRLYPPFQIVARHYKSMIEAWRDLGYQVKERSLTYWTRDEVIAGLKRFYKDFRICPTYHGYLDRAQFAPKYRKNGKPDAAGAYGKYPSFPCIRKYFKTFREAWTAAGFEVDRHWEEWTPEEDWFAVESCGILPRQEVADYLGRTVAAVKRRLYDLGRITANERWGISVNRAEALMRVPGQMIYRYIKHGVIPVFRGNKNIYLNPADLLKIEEFDWKSSNINPELQSLVRRALVQRALKILLFRDRWREHEIYRAESAKVYHGRIKNPSRSPLLENTPAPPNALKTGDWAHVVERYKQIAPDRQGRICSVRFSWQQARRKDGTRRACWMAIVEFPKLRTVTGEKSRRIRYSLPLDRLAACAPPEIEKPPLKQTPEAVRGRKRFQKHLARASNRFREIKPELS